MGSTVQKIIFFWSGQPLKVAILITIFNPLTPMSDQDRISPYNINTISSRKVMRITKNTNEGIIS